MSHLTVQKRTGRVMIFLSLWTRRALLGAAYDAYASDYDNRPFDALLGIPRLRQDLVSQATGRVLEVAAGTGLNLPYYKNAVVTLLDSSPRMLDVAKSKMDVKTVVGDAQRLPFDDNTFDSIVSTFSMCVFDEPEAVLREMRRVVKGRVFLLENTRPENPLLASYFDLTASSSSFTKGCRQNRDVSALVRSAGFRVEAEDAFFGGLFKSYVLQR